MQDDAEKTKYFAGPLNLDRKTKQADTVIGTELVLDETEFDVLDALVAQEGESVAFERLYEDFWKSSDGADNRAAARAALNGLMEKVSIAGKSFMGIEYSPEKGYKFYTHWGHNWSSRQPQLESNITPAEEIIPPGITKVRDRRLKIWLLTGVGAAVAAIILIITTMYNDLKIDASTIDEVNVPLTGWEDGSGTYCAETEECLAAGECVKAPECLEMENEAG